MHSAYDDMLAPHCLFEIVYNFLRLFVKIAFSQIGNMSFKFPGQMGLTLLGTEVIPLQLAPQCCCF